MAEAERGRPNRQGRNKKSATAKATGRKKRWTPAQDVGCAPFIRMLHGGDIGKLQEAIIALAVRGCTDEFDRLREILFTNDERISGYIRMEVVDSFGETKEARAVPDLGLLATRMNSSRNYLFLYRVVLALGRIATPEAKSVVGRFVDHDDSLVRNSARAMVGIWNPSFAAGASEEEDEARKAVLANIKDGTRRKEMLEQKRRLRLAKDMADTLEWMARVRRKDEAAMLRKKRYLDAVASGNILTNTIWRRVNGPWSDEYFALIKAGKVLTAEVFYMLRGGK